jgi:bifunctional DNA-binding transcriptional regulator/antitoxin component of YhaV-PrlF toxin-antitoxin module
VDHVEGQVTIPQDIREQAGFMPDTEVDFVWDGELVYRVNSAERGGRPTRGQRAVAALRLHGPGITMSTTRSWP